MAQLKGEACEKRLSVEEFYVQLLENITDITVNLTENHVGGIDQALHKLTIITDHYLH